MTEELVRTLPPPTASPKHQAQMEQRRAARLARFARARELPAQGWPIRAIGRERGGHRTTVRTALRAPHWPARQPRGRCTPGGLDPFIPYLIARWPAGCRNGTTLWQESSARGDTGKRVTVFSFGTRRRKALGIPATNRTSQGGTVVLPAERPRTPRKAVWQVRPRPDKRAATTEQRREQLRQAHADLATAMTVTADLATLMRTRDLVALDRWREQAAASMHKPFRNCAARRRRDDAAVRAGGEQPGSTGPVAGAINQLKLLKRAMVGRAGVALLQRRVRLAT